jgi:hypothetical protein
MARLAFGRHIENSMRWYRPEPTVAEILVDPIVQALMEADGIDPQALEAQLRNMARAIVAGRNVDQHESHAS